jgi:seryl-tRNA synthetase
MATKKKSGGSIVGLTKQKKALKAKISAANKKKKDEIRARKLRAEVASLKNKLKTTSKKKK